MKIFALVFGLYITSVGFSQSEVESDCIIKGGKDWEKVELRALESKTVKIEGLERDGEWDIKVHKDIHRLEDLSEKEVIKIKKMVARSKGCIVYVDVYGLLDDKYYDERKDDRLYFYWFKKRPE